MSFLRFIGYMLSILFPYKILRKFTMMKNAVHSGYIIRQFKSVGKNFAVEFPIRMAGAKYIQIGDNFICGQRLRIEAHDRFLNHFYKPQIIIGNNVNINFDCHIGCIDKVQIGKNVLIASKVLIMDHLHGEANAASIKLPPTERPLLTKGPIIIGDNVLIGEGCAILPGVTVGANCIIGSNAVVTKSFAENTLIGGNPARVIRQLN